MGKNIKEKVLNFGALSGILGPGIMGLGMLVAALAYIGVDGQHYNLLNHFVSELGELDVSDWAWAFNWSLILGGTLTTVFMLYLAYRVEHWLRYPLGLISVYATINGALVGVYPMNYLDPHLRVAMAFFNLGMLIAFLYSLLFLFGKKHPFPRWIAIPGLLNAAAFALFLNFPPSFDVNLGFEEGMGGLLTNRPAFIPLALMEWVVILGIMIWILMLGGYLFMNCRYNQTPSE